MTPSHSDLPAIRVCAACVGSGFVLAVPFTAALLWLDVGGLRQLALEGEGGTLGLGLFWVLNGLAMGGAQVALFLRRAARPAEAARRAAHRKALAPSRG